MLILAVEAPSFHYANYSNIVFDFIDYCLFTIFLEESAEDGRLLSPNRTSSTMLVIFHRLVNLKARRFQIS